MVKIRLTEADSDYINVGNIMLPRDAREYGWDSYDSVRKKTQQRYDDEKEAERQAREREEAERRRQEFIAEHQDEIGKAEEILNSADDPTAILDNLDTEMADGESAGWYIVSAYTGLSDVGDYFFTGDAIEECGDLAGLLIDSQYTEGELKKPIMDFLKKVDNENYAVWNLDKDYSAFMSELAGEIVDFLANHLELFATPFEEDYSDFEEWKDELDEMSRCYEYEISSYNMDMTPYWDELEEAGLVDFDDLYEFVRNCSLIDWDTDIDQWASDVITVKRLNLEQLKAWESEFYDYYESWIEEVYEDNRDKLGTIHFDTDDKTYSFNKEDLKERVEYSFRGIPRLDDEISDVYIEYANYDTDDIDEDVVSTFRDLCDYLDISYVDYEDALNDDGGEE